MDVSIWMIELACAINEFCNLSIPILNVWLPAINNRLIFYVRGSYSGISEYADYITCTKNGYSMLQYDVRAVMFVAQATIFGLVYIISHP